jgi:hypothetical protein
MFIVNRKIPIPTFADHGTEVPVFQGGVAEEAINIAAHNYKNKSTGKQQKFCLICLHGFGMINAYVRGDRFSWTFHMD